VWRYREKFVEVQEEVAYFVDGVKLGSKKRPKFD